MMDDDDQMMAALKEALAEARLVTAGDRSLAQSAFGWQAVQAELMELLQDSALSAGAAVRSGESARDLTFSGSGISLALEIDAALTIRGQVLPGQVATVVLDQPAGEPVTALSDEDGFFEFTSVTPGSARLTITTDSTRLTTSWITL